MAINTQGGMAFVDMESARVCESARVPWHPPYDQGSWLMPIVRGCCGCILSADYGCTATPRTHGHDSLGGAPLPQGYVMSVLQDRDGRVWIGYDHDGIVVFEKNGHMQRVVSDPDNNRTLSSNIVTVLMEDRTGSIWVGSRKTASLSTTTALQVRLYALSRHKLHIRRQRWPRVGWNRQPRPAEPRQEYRGKPHYCHRERRTVS